MADPTRLSMIALSLAVAASMGLLVTGGRPIRLSRPATLVGTMAMIMVVCGPWSYYATRQFFPQFYVPINRALIYAAFGIGITALACRLVIRLPAPSTPRAVWEWSPAILDRLVTALLILAVVGTIGSLARIGYVPLFRGDIREERLLYADEAGIFFRLSLLGAAASVLGGVRWMQFGRTTTAVIAVPIGVVCTALYGPRFFPFVAIGILFVCYDAYVRRVRPLRLIAGGVIVAALGIFAAVHREAAGTFVFEQGVLPLDARTVFNAMGYVSVPEFRDFAWSLDYFDEDRHRLHGETIAGAAVAILPAAAWSVVGVDKEALYSRDSGTIMSEILGQNTGIRIGILGELYMNFGLWGITIGMCLFGTLIGWEERRLARGSLADPVIPLVALLVIVSTFALIGILHMFVSSVVLFGWPLVLAALLGARRVEAGVARPPAPAYGHLAH